MRVLLTLRKGEEIKYVSHRDFVRAFGFALRRAEIPVAYSAGFNPRPRMSFGPATGVGVTSEDEKILLELDSPVEASDVMARLNAQLPPGMRVTGTEAIPDGAKSPISGLNASRFRITFSHDGQYTRRQVEEAAEKLLASNEIRIVRERRDAKEVDIRPHVLLLEVAEHDDRSVVVEALLRSGDSGGARPQDIVQALRSLLSGLEARGIHRLKHMSADRARPGIVQEQASE
jgi:radical SAM-linked protein